MVVGQVEAQRSEPTAGVVHLPSASPFVRGDLIELKPELGLHIRGEVWATEERDGVLYVHLRGGKWWRAADLQRVESTA